MLNPQTGRDGGRPGFAGLLLYIYEYASTPTKFSVPQGAMLR